MIFKKFVKSLFIFGFLANINIQTTNIQVNTKGVPVSAQSTFAQINPTLLVQPAKSANIPAQAPSAQVTNNNPANQWQEGIISAAWDGFKQAYNMNFNWFTRFLARKSNLASQKDAVLTEALIEGYHYETAQFVAEKALERTAFNNTLNGLGITSVLNAGFAAYDRYQSNRDIVSVLETISNVVTKNVTDFVGYHPERTDSTAKALLNTGVRLGTYTATSALMSAALSRVGSWGTAAIGIATAASAASYFI